MRGNVKSGGWFGPFVVLLGLTVSGYAQPSEPKPADDVPKPTIASEDQPATKKSATKKSATNETATKMSAEVPSLPEEPDGPRRIGRILRLSLPLNERSVSKVKRFVDRSLETAQREDAYPVLIFEFQVPPDAAAFGKGSQFGVALEMARFLTSDALRDATTVAWIPQSIAGHAVLVAVACDEILIAPEASIGEAGVDEKRIEAYLTSGYREIAKRRRTVPVELVLGMLDPQREVWEVESESGRQFVTPEGLAELEEKETVLQKRPFLRAGQTGRFTGVEARRLGVASRLVSNRTELARALEMSREAIQEETPMLRSPRAVRVDLTGPIRADLVGQVQKRIEEAVSRGEANLILLFLDSPGGSPTDSLNLANFLALDLVSETVRTIAYIPSEARADAALVALACDQVVMRPDAILGGPGAYEPNELEVETISRALRESLSEAKGFDWSLPVAMFDSTLTVYRCTRNGRVDFFSEAELNAQKDPKAWIRGEPVTRPGMVFSTVGRDAPEYHLAQHTVENFSQLKEIYGLEEDPALVEPSWADRLIEALASPGVAVFFLMIGGAALYAELHSPGIGLGAFVGGVCFLLFFWSQYLGGTAGWLEAMLFLAGVGCLLLEIFVLPGFGIFGLGGGILVLVSVVLACQTFIFPRNPYQFAQLQRSLLVVLGAGFGVMVLGYWMNRWLPKTPVLGNLMLPPPNEEEKQRVGRRESMVHFERLLGLEGVTTTPLTPSGKARFGKELVDVISDGERIGPGRTVRVVEVHGNRVLVDVVAGPS